MRYALIVLSLFISANAFAAEQCKQINIEAFTNEFKNLLPASVSSLMAGNTGTLRGISAGNICYETPSVDLNTVLSQTAVESRISQIISDAELTPAKIAAAQSAADDDLQVSVKEAFTAWVQVYNSKVPAQYRVTKVELVEQIKANR